MAQVSRKIKRQIQSIKNTKKITKAMEMVSASKMKKSINAVLATRPYARMAWQMILDLASRTDRSLHPLLQERNDIKKIGIVILSSNRGLCGIFNQQVIRQALKLAKFVADKLDNKSYEFITLGRKGAQALIKTGYSIVADFEKADVVTDVADIKAISKMIVDGFLEKKYDKVYLIYTDFINSLKQKATIKQLLPIILTPEVGLELTGEFPGEKIQEAPKSKYTFEYRFEPNPTFILENFLPRLIEVQIYQAILESNASEHSARMVAMRNASDAASDLISDLTLTFNKVRQAGITQELSEISTSKTTLEE